MAAHKSFPRRELRRLYRGTIARNRGVYAGATVFFLVAIGVTTGSMWQLADDHPVWAYLMGVMHAGTVAVLVAMSFVAFIAVNPEGVWQLRGAWGEDNTRDELKRAKRRGLIWGSVSSVPLRDGDIDHLVVTRRAGLVTIDSKWRNQAHDVQAMAADARRAKLRAEAIARTLLAKERGARHRASAQPLSVKSVVVVWGALQTEIPDAAQVDGVDFVAGRHLLRWLRELEGHPVPKDAAQDILRRIAGFQASAFAAQSARQP